MTLTFTHFLPNQHSSPNSSIVQRLKEKAGVGVSLALGSGVMGRGGSPAPLTQQNQKHFITKAQHHISSAPKFAPSTASVLRMLRFVLPLIQMPRSTCTKNTTIMRKESRSSLWGGGANPPDNRHKDENNRYGRFYVKCSLCFYLRLKVQKPISANMI